MPADVRAVARRLFEGVMAPLVVGGTVRPGHAIGARAALALTQAAGADAVDAGLLDRVQTGRLRRARRYAPIDVVQLPTDAEWALAAALHDVLQAANPTLDRTLRRRTATRILEVAVETIDAVADPSTPGEALSRHTWLARLPGLARTDTEVSWWSGSQTFRGVDPPARLQAWPDLRRVHVVATARPLLEVGPLAVDRGHLIEAVARLIDRSPLTSLATCTRATPPFAWSASTLALATTHVGRALTQRVLERLPAADVHAVLGRATRDRLERAGAMADPALTLLSDLAIARAMGHAVDSETATTPDADLANALGAAVAVRRLESGEPGWTPAARRQALLQLVSVAASDAGRQAMAILAARA